MAIRKNFLLIILMMLVSASVPRVSRGRPVAGSSKAKDSPEDTVKQILLYCGLNPIGMQSVVRSLDFSNLHSIVTDSAEIKINRKFVNEFIHEKQRALPNCQSEDIFLYVPGEDSYRNQCYEYLTSLFTWDTLSRRHLADQHRPNPPTLAPFPVLVSFSSLDHSVESASYSKAPSSFPLLVSPSDSPMVSDTILPPEKHKKSKPAVGTSVALTAAGISVLAILVFFCCKGCFGNKNDGNGVKDESPLLTLNASDFSGSSNNSVGMGGAIKMDKIGSLCLKIESSLNSHIVNLECSGETPSSSDSSKASSNNIAMTMSSLPPLKPPPGRKMASTAPVPPPPAPPPPLRKPKPGLPPPAPPKTAPPCPPRPIHISSKVPHPGPLMPNCSGDTSADAHAPKAKLKPLFWDKVSTNPENAMVWNDIKSGSFQFNEERIETLFGYCTDDKGKNENKKASSFNDPPQYIQLLEPKKSQNLAISLKAMAVKVDEVSDALMEGNELPAELLQTLLRMTPTTDEELRIRLYTGDPALLGPGEQFIKAIMEIPCAFKRMDALLFMASLQEDVASIRESFACLEVASKELRNSRLFLKLLEAVLKLGNRMNDGTFRGGAQAFKLDTLLKLSDVKGTDGKTTLLHFVVQEIIRSEGARAVRLAKEKTLTASSSPSYDRTDDPVEELEDHYRDLGLKAVSVLSTDLENVKKAAGMDAEALTAGVASLGRELAKTKEFLNTDMKSMDEVSGFHKALRSFIDHAEADISLLREKEEKVKSLVKSTTDYFHGKSGGDEGLKLFIIVRDFLGMLDKACKEVRESQKKIVNARRSRDSPTLSPSPEPRQRLFPAIRDRRVDSSSSDDEEP